MLSLVANKLRMIRSTASRPQGPSPVKREGENSDLSTLPIFHIPRGHVWYMGIDLNVTNPDPKMSGREKNHAQTHILRESVKGHQGLWISNLFP